MKITIDTTAKTATVHGEATFEEVIDIIKAVCPKGWNSYLLTCENLPLLSLSNGSGAISSNPNLFVLRSGMGEPIECKQ